MPILVVLLGAFSNELANLDELMSKKELGDLTWIVIDFDWSIFFTKQADNIHFKIMSDLCAIIWSYYDSISNRYRSGVFLALAHRIQLVTRSYELIICYALIMLIMLFDPI